MEDGLADVIKPRLLKLDDPRIEQAIIAAGAKFTIIDTITAYCNAWGK
jgi:hypothetical protein